METIYRNHESNPVGEIDFHIHTSNSDGENTYEEMVEMAKKRGLKVIAITDHNRFTTTRTIMEDGLLILPGAEISAAYSNETGNVKQRETKESHIIGLFPKGVDPKDFDDLLNHISEGREAYLRGILKSLERRGKHVTYEEVKAVTPDGKGSGRHQIGLVLIQKGYAKDITDAFDNHIGNFSPYYIPSTNYISYPLFAKVIKRIRECNGIPVLCHPFAYGFSLDEIEAFIRAFKYYAGKVAALEVYYDRYRNEPWKIQFLEAMAKKYDLLISAGSDSHSLEQSFAKDGTLEMYEKMMECLDSK